MEIIYELNKQMLFLPEECRFALYLYTKGSNIFNDLLRSNISSIKKLTMLKDIERAFKLIPPLKDDLIVYRAVNADKSSDIDKKIKILTSTSYDIRTTLTFIKNKCCIMKIKIPKGSRVLCMDTLSYFSGDVNEFEILLPPGGNFVEINDNIKKSTIPSILTKFQIKLYDYNYKIDFGKKYEEEINRINKEVIHKFTDQIAILTALCRNSEVNEIYACLKEHQLTEDFLKEDQFIVEYLTDIMAKNIIKKQKKNMSEQEKKKFDKEYSKINYEETLKYYKEKYKNFKIVDDSYRKISLQNKNRRKTESDIKNIKEKEFVLEDYIRQSPWFY